MLFLALSQWSEAAHRRKFALSNSIEMRTKQTIAIIGLGDVGKGLATALAKGTDRVLLFDENAKEAENFTANLLKANPAYDVEFMICAANASWEADIIIPTVAQAELPKITAYIKEYVNQKIVISIGNTCNGYALQELLPNVKVVKTFTNEVSVNQPTKGKMVDCHIEGSETSIVENVVDLIKTIGFNPVVINPTKTEIIELV
ncbi:MAG: oxidoreductase coenzyme F420-dependent [Segetibacter sp.]|nr:oxidoreductase coenzyme F420-dependent [Segetibacter sp.]